jgi:hypothetical protein
MEEQDRVGQPCCEDKKKKSNCIINIFCHEKKHDDMAGCKGDGCIINIFCDDKKHPGPDGDKKDDESCVINIFCNNKKPDGKEPL